MSADGPPPRPVRPRGATTGLGKNAPQTIALNVLALYAGPAPRAAAVAAAAQRAYDELGRAVIPLLGQSGVEALIGRAVHLAQRDHPSLISTPEADRTAGSLAPVILSLGREDPAVSLAAGGAVFASFTGLLVAFIGEPLTTRLLRQAWTAAFVTATTEET